MTHTLPAVRTAARRKGARMTRELTSSFPAGMVRLADGADVFTCAECGYFRAVPLPSGHVRTFCIFTGEKVSPSRPACSFRLTCGGLPAMLEVPNDDGRNRRLALAPQGAKVLSIPAYHARAAFCAVRAYIGRAQRPGRREAPAAHRQPGSVVALPFSFNPTMTRCFHALRFHQRLASQSEPFTGPNFPAFFLSKSH